MTETENAIECKRCGHHKAAAEDVTYGGELGNEIRRHTCAECWLKWLDTEVIVINELKLNFMEPQSLDTLTQHLRDFLQLDTAAPTS